jgi:hypothetical protein
MLIRFSTHTCLCDISANSNQLCNTLYIWRAMGFIALQINLSDSFIILSARGTSRGAAVCDEFFLEKSHPGQKASGTSHDVLCLSLFQALVKQSTPAPACFVEFWWWEFLRLNCWHSQMRSDLKEITVIRKFKKFQENQVWRNVWFNLIFMVNYQGRLMWT